MQILIILNWQSKNFASGVEIHRRRKKMKNNNLNRWTFALVLTMICSILLSVPIKAAPGDLDTTFGNGGKVLTAITPQDDVPTRVRVQPDGKIVTVGWTQTPQGTGSFVVRHNADGTLDATFGTNGLAILAPQINQFVVFEDFIVLSDGKLLVVGDSANPPARALTLCRFNANGTIDSTFGNAGSLVFPFGSQSTGRRIVLLPDGKFLVNGWTSANFQSASNLLAKFNSNGTLDTSFGTNGSVITQIGADLSPLRFFDNGEALLQPDGKILIAGSAIFGSSRDFFVARYNQNGTLDNLFGTNGVVNTDIGNLRNNIGGMVLQPDGKIVINGRNYSGNLLQSSAILRFNANGTLDPAFGTNGIVMVSEPNPNGYAFSYTLALQANGKIFNGGSRNGTFAISRYNSNGTLDTAFGDNGVVTTVLGTFVAYDTILASTIQPDGKLVVAGGVSVDANFIWDLGLVRYQLDNPQVIRKNVPLDFTGDGRTDWATISFGVGANMPLRWKITGNPAPATPNAAFKREFDYGFNSDFPVPGDYTGDRKTEVAVRRGGTPAIVYVAQFPSGVGGITLERAVPWGQSSDRPGAQGDYDGDGKVDYTVVRDTGGVLTWYILSSSTGTQRAIPFGSVPAGITVVVTEGADFTGDGRDELVLFTYETATFAGLTFYIGDANTGVGILTIAYGNFFNDRVITPADYTGDGRADIVVARQTIPATWYIRNTATGATTATSFGIGGFDPAADRPVRGDYDGDGRHDIAVYRPDNQTFYYLRSSSNNTVVDGQKHGDPDDYPLGFLGVY
jgi:uncharacterized delta-60 repeat protein